MPAIITANNRLVFLLFRRQAENLSSQPGLIV